jgi:hypothetical protein
MNRLLALAALVAAMWVLPAPAQASATGLDNFSFGTATPPVAAVPEPAPLLVVGSGLALLAVRASRRGDRDPRP